MNQTTQSTRKPELLYPSFRRPSPLVRFLLVLPLALAMLAALATCSEEGGRKQVTLKPLTGGSSVISADEKPVENLKGNTIELSVTRLDTTDLPQPTNRTNPLKLTLSRTGTDWLVVDFVYSFEFILDAWRINDSLQIWLSGDGAFATQYQYYPLTYYGTSMRVKQGFSSNMHGVDKPWEWGMITDVKQTHTSMSGRLLVRVPKLEKGDTRIAALFMSTNDDQDANIELPIASYPAHVNTSIVSPERFPKFSYTLLPSIEVDLQALVTSAQMLSVEEQKVHDAVNAINESVNSATAMVDRIKAQQEMEAASEKVRELYAEAAQTLGNHAGNDYNILRVKAAKDLTTEELVAFAQRNPALLYTGFMMVNKGLMSDQARPAALRAAQQIVASYADGGDAERRFANWAITRIAEMLLVKESDTEGFLSFIEATAAERSKLSGMVSSSMPVLAVIACLYADQEDPDKLREALELFPGPEELGDLLGRVSSVLFPQEQAVNQLYARAVPRLLRALVGRDVATQMWYLTGQAAEAQRSGASSDFDAVEAFELLAPYIDAYVATLEDPSRQADFRALATLQMESAKIYEATSLTADSLKAAYQNVAQASGENVRFNGAGLTKEILSRVLRELVKQNVDARRSIGLTLLELLREYSDATSPVSLSVILGENALELLDTEEADFWLGHAAQTMSNIKENEANFPENLRFSEEDQQAFTARMKRLNLGVELFRTAPSDEHVKKAWEEVLDVKVADQRKNRNAFVVSRLMLVGRERETGGPAPLLSLPALRGRSVVAHEAAKRIDALLAADQDDGARFRLAVRMAAHFTDLRKLAEAREWLVRADQAYAAFGKPATERLQEFSSYATLPYLITAIESDYPKALEDLAKRMQEAGLSEGEKTYLKSVEAQFLSAMQRATDEAKLINAEANDLPKVQLVTDVGTIELVLFEDDAPNTVASFIELIEIGFYNGLNFHRFVPSFVAQGGDPNSDGSGGPGYGIRLEAKRRHLRGSISMARSGHPDSAGSQFFLCLSDLTALHLDGGYACFGRVTKGLDVMDKLRVDSTILSARVLSKRDHAYTVEKLPERE